MQPRNCTQECSYWKNNCFTMTRKLSISLFHLSLQQNWLSLEQIIPLIIIHTFKEKENSSPTLPSNDVGGSELLKKKKKKALSLATLLNSDRGQQFCPLVLFLLFEGGQYHTLLCPRFFHYIIRSLPFLCHLCQR